ncbi:MAG TPA: M48 family metallopeptidase [Polyangiaceae bacterium]|jgi:Zn-dependent protease with chaperone function
MKRNASFAFRAFLALGLLFGFYGLALSLAGLLVWLPYVSVFHLHKFHAKLILLSLGGAFAIVRALFSVRRPVFHAPGPEIHEADEPALFAVIREVAGRMKTPMPVHVYLVPDVNAFVTEVGGFLGFGTTRVMGIGMGLLHVGDVSGLKATLAHEFGHFVGSDTALGGVVYRTRAAIGQMLASLEDTVLSKPFEWYGSLYLRVTFAVSRHQELEADRAGILLAGRDAHIEGLTKEVRAGVLFGIFLRSEIAPLCEAGLCPQSIYEGFENFLVRFPSEKVDKLLAEDKTDKHDTHPALTDRLAFARTVPDPGVARDVRPALSLLRAPKAAEEKLEPYVFHELEVKGALRRVAWEDVAAKFWAPRLAEEARGYAERLYPVLKAGPSYGDVVRAFGAAMSPPERERLARVLEPRLEGAPAFVLEKAVPGILGRALGVLVGAAMVERGGAWETSVGAPLTVAFEGTSHAPLDLAREAVEKGTSLQPVLALA